MTENNLKLKTFDATASKAIRVIGYIILAAIAFVLLFLTFINVTVNPHMRTDSGKKIYEMNETQDTKGN